MSEQDRTSSGSNAAAAAFGGVSSPKRADKTADAGSETASRKNAPGMAAARAAAARRGGIGR